MLQFEIRGDNAYVHKKIPHKEFNLSIAFPLSPTDNGIITFRNLKSLWKAQLEFIYIHFSPLLGTKLNSHPLIVKTLL